MLYSWPSVLRASQGWRPHALSARIEEASSSHGGADVMQLIQVVAVDTRNSVLGNESRRRSFGHRSDRSGGKRSQLLSDVCTRAIYSSCADSSVQDIIIIIIIKVTASLQVTATPRIIRYSERLPLLRHCLSLVECSGTPHKAMNLVVLADSSGLVCVSEWEPKSPRKSPNVTYNTTSM